MKLHWPSAKAGKTVGARRQRDTARSHNTAAAFQYTRPTRRFIARNDGFTCRACGVSVPPAPGGYRNHCPRCLVSLHVDRFPGDRAEPCAGQMDPIGISRDSDDWIVHHRCRRCGAERENRRARDDAWDRVVEISMLPVPC